MQCATRQMDVLPAVHLSTQGEAAFFRVYTAGLERLYTGCTWPGCSDWSPQNKVNRSSPWACVATGVVVT